MSSSPWRSRCLWGPCPPLSVIRLECPAISDGRAVLRVSGPLHSRALALPLPVALARFALRFPLRLPTVIQVSLGPAPSDCSLLPSVLAWPAPALTS